MTTSRSESLPKLLRLDVGRPDHLAPLLGFLNHQLAEFSRRHRHELAADGQLWERVIVEDFAEFRKAGLTHPMMADIEKELGVSPDHR